MRKGILSPEEEQRRVYGTRVRIESHRLKRSYTTNADQRLALTEAVTGLLKSIGEPPETTAQINAPYEPLPIKITSATAETKSAPEGNSHTPRRRKLPITLSQLTLIIGAILITASSLFPNWAMSGSASDYFSVQRASVGRSFFLSPPKTTFGEMLIPAIDYQSQAVELLSILAITGLLFLASKPAVRSAHP